MIGAGRVILGFDTATPLTAVAVLSDCASAERALDPVGGRPVHGVSLLRTIEDLVADAGGWGRVDLIAVGVGPGSFTGLRIGVATARALAQSRSLPAVGVPSTSAMLAGIAASPEAAGRARLAVIDARRGEVFAALDPAQRRGGADLPRPEGKIRATEGKATAAGAKPPAAAAGTLAAEPIVCAPAELAARFGPEAVASAVAAGDGAVRFRAEIEAAGALVLADGDDAHRPSASRICELAAALEPVGPERIRPMYLRRPDAERWRERDGRN